MKLDYAVLDPTGNITVLVATPVPPALQPQAAARLMAAEPAAEQVGFFSPAPDGGDLRMAGGEFCGNAAMSAAVLRALDAELREGRFSLRVSGAAEPVAVEITRLRGGVYRGRVCMPPPEAVGEERFPDGVLRPVVRLPGIAHVLLERAPERSAAEALAPQWCAFLGAPALGLLFLDRAAGSMTPLVYVPGAGTLCWENSCASGTTAAAAWLSRDGGGAFSVSLRQPGGVLEAEVSPAGGIALSGVVTLVKRGRLDVSL